jgi:hypothetical protein
MDRWPTGSGTDPLQAGTPRKGEINPPSQGRGHSFETINGPAALPVSQSFPGNLLPGTEVRQALENGAQRGHEDQVAEEDHIRIYVQHFPLL